MPSTPDPAPDVDGAPGRRRNRGFPQGLLRCGLNWHPAGRAGEISRGGVCVCVRECACTCVLGREGGNEKNGPGV